MARRRRQRPPPRGYVGRGGGVGQRPSPKPKQPSSGPTLPPYLTFDPGIAAELRASERGLEDIREDTKTKRHYARRDLAQALRDIKTSASRSRGKLKREAFRSRSGLDLDFSRGQRKLGEQESSVRTDAQRSSQDFDTQLANIGRKFAQLGQRQGEAASAAGVLGGGTAAASAAARARNKTIAEAPVHVARARTEEDLATALRQIGTARQDLGADYGRETGYLSEDLARGLRQLHADRDRTRKLAKREHGRTMFKLKRDYQRAIREGKFAKADLISQAIYDARQNHPGAFTKSGHGGGAHGAGGGGGQHKPKRRKKHKPNRGGGTAAPRRGRKRKR